MFKFVYVCCLTVCILAFSAKSQLRAGFYSSTCPRAEFIVRSTVQTHFNSNPTIAPGLLRLHFHDCFIQGCDASVLISGPSAERTAFPNIGLRGFEVVEDAKARLESVCPGVVSCADILALATRNAVQMTGGPTWVVPLGRRDGRVSSASEVVQNLVSPFDSVAAQRQKFAAKGLNDHDLVTLVGAHTIGSTQCRFFQHRIYNFSQTRSFDPTINPLFVGELQRSCPRNGNGLNRVALDKDSHRRFDVSFFKNLKDGNGVLESDQRLWDDVATRAIVQNYAGNLRGLRFDLDFARAMVKMGNIGVKTGSNGEIRKICSRFN